MICVYCHKAEVAGGPGPTDACIQCKMTMYFIGRLTAEITPVMAHIIMGAFNLCDSEGYINIPDVTNDPDKHEVEVVRLLYKIHPAVVRHEHYASMCSVKEILK